MTQLAKLKLRIGTGELQSDDDNLLQELLDAAEAAILNRRYPWGYDPETAYVEPRYYDLQVKIAQDLYNKMGAEGETNHRENGVSRIWESNWISESLLREVVPMAGVIF